MDAEDRSRMNHGEEAPRRGLSQRDRFVLMLIAAGLCVLLMVFAPDDSKWGFAVPAAAFGLAALIFRVKVWKPEERGPADKSDRV